MNDVDASPSGANVGRATGPARIRIVIADDHPMVREGIARLLSAERDMAVVSQATDGTETLACLRAVACDVLVLDLAMPPPRGPELIREVRKAFPQLRILILSMHDHPGVIRAALSSGADGYVNKGGEPDDLLAAVRRVAAGRRWLQSDMAERLLFIGPDLGTGTDPLTPRERQVLELLLTGRGNSEIARELDLSEKTISTYKSHIMDKLGMGSLVELVRYADQQLLFALPNDDRA